MIYLLTVLTCATPAACHTERTPYPTRAACLAAERAVKRDGVTAHCHRQWPVAEVE